MVIEIELPDGSIAEFPDNMSTNEIKAVLQKKYPAQAQQQKNQTEQAQQQKTDEGGVIDFLGDTLAKSGRVVVGGTSGLAGIVSDPLNATINMAGEALGYNPNLGTDLRKTSLQLYDEATGGRGVPQGALERIIHAGGENLLGGGIAGGMAKAAKATPAIVEAVGVNNIPSALSEIAGGALAQAGVEINPENPLLSSLIGGFVGSITPMAVANAPENIAKALGVVPKNVAIIEKAGMPLNIPAVSDSNAVRSMSSASQNVIGGGKLKKSMDTAYGRAEISLRNLGFTGTTTPEMAGETVKQGLIKWRNQKKIKFKKMDAIFDEFVPPMTKLDSKSFSSFADDAIENIAKGEGLTQQQVLNRLNHPALQQLQALSDAAKAGEPITLNALNEARKNIGELTAKSPLTPDFDSVITSKTYDALHQMRREAARAVGGEEAVNLLDVKNRFYKKYIDEEKSFNAKLVKKLGDNPESIFQQMTSGDKVGASNAKRTLARLTATERDVFRDALIYQKGGGENFSIGKWANEYSKMSKEAKSAFFMGKPSLQRAHDDLMKGVNVYKELGQFKNTSNTAAHNLFNNLITGGGIGAAVTGFSGVAGSIATGLAANKVFATVMASPKATKILANSLKNPPATESVLRSSLVKTFKAAGYTDDTASQDVNALLQDAIERSNSMSLEHDNQLLEQQIAPQNNTFVREMPLGEGASFTQANEGFSSVRYNDSLGNPTIGYGFNFNSGIAPRVWKEAGIQTPYKQAKLGKAAITPQEAQALYQTHERIAINDARNYYPDFDRLRPQQQMALIDMSYQMGGSTLNQFAGLKKALKSNNKNAIISSIRTSKYYTQTPERAERVLRMLVTEDRQ